jgi:hypothetical protein
LGDFKWVVIAEEAKPTFSVLTPYISAKQPPHRTLPRTRAHTNANMVGVGADTTVHAGVVQ